MSTVVRGIFICIIVFTSGICHAAFVAGSYGIRYEKDSETSELVPRFPHGVVVGHRTGMLSWTGEYLTFLEQSGNQTLRLTRKQHLGLLGARYHAFDQEDLFSWYPYFAGGVGAYREVVRTELLGIANEQTSKWKPAGTLGVGFFGRVVPHVHLGADFRVMVLTDFDPRGLLDLSLRLGYQFD